MEQEDKAAAGVYKIKKSKGNKKTEQQQDIRKRRVKGTRRQSSSRGNKIKKSKVEQEDRAAAGVIRERRG